MDSMFDVPRKVLDLVLFIIVMLFKPFSVLEWILVSY